MEEATQFAEATQVLMNVSEFTDVSKATDSLISSIQAFKYTAEESMDVVDILNEIGNNYAISTSDLAESLTKSSGSLVAANGTLEEAVALTATANTIIQDADVVGTALKTVAMRLRGTSTKEMEEEGLETDGAITSKSKLQSKVKGLSGVDILTDTGAYKSTYQILSEIADVWKDISDIDQAALLEILAGKRGGSVMAAILQNPDTLKDAFESASEASGSALVENEKYMDSIQGRIDQFNNALQTMWNNELNGDVIKWFVGLGKVLIQTIDKLGLLGTAFIVVSLAIMKMNKMNLVEYFGNISDSILKYGTKLKNLALGLTSVATAQSTLTASTIEASIANGTLTASEAARLATTNGLTIATTSLNAAEAAEMLTKGGMVEADALALVAKLGLSKQTSNLTLETVKSTMANAGYTPTQIAAAQAALFGASANTTLAGSFTALWTAMWPVLALMGGIFIISKVVKGISELIVTAEEASEQLNETKNNISSLKTELGSLDTKLDETRDKIVELTALPSLSLTQQEDLDRLEREVELLERQIVLKERQLAIEEAKLVEDAETTIDKKWNKSGAYDLTNDGKIQEDKWNTWGNSGEDVVNRAIEKYVEKDEDTKALETMLPNWEDWSTSERQDAMSKLNNRYDYDIGTAYDDTQQIIDAINEAESNKTEIAKSIEDFFADPDYAGLEYGMSDEIDAFLDDYNNARLKWEKALYGDNSNASAIQSLFGSNATEEMQELKSEIDEIMAGDDDWDSKNSAIRKHLDSINETADGYQQLKFVMDELDVSRQDIADYFTIQNGEFNSSTLEGITAQYQRGIEILEQFRDTNTDTISERMKKLQEGGNVDLFNRPQIDASKLTQAGWENAGEGIATVQSATYSKKDWDETIASDNNIAMNFTPILTDQNGEEQGILSSDTLSAYLNNVKNGMHDNYLGFTEENGLIYSTELHMSNENGQDIGVLSPEALEAYAANVINGVHDDYLGIKIGAEFEGEDAIKQASQAAQEIHNLQSSYYLGDDVITIEGVGYDWDELFSKDDEGKLEARADKFAEILKGMDNETRKAFINIAESVANGEISWDQAIERFSIASMQAVVKQMKTEVESLNKEVFKGLDDEISGIIDTFDEFSAALENVASTMDLLHTAQTQMNNSGRISVKTALELIASTDQWNQVLAIENGQIRLVDGAEQVLIQTKLNAIKANIELALQEVNTSLAMLDAGGAALTLSDKLGNILTASIDKVKEGLAWLDAAAGALWDNIFHGGSSNVVAAGNAAAASVKKSRASEISGLQQQKRDLEAQLEMLKGIDTVSEFKNNYDFDKTPGDKYKDDSGDDDRLENIQKRYEGKIQELENQMTYIENENERLEEIGMSASKQSYEELIDREEKKIALYKEERDELEQLLTAYDPTSEKYAEVANAIWEMNHAIQESTVNMIQNRKAIIDLYSDAFEKIGEAYDNENAIYDDQLTSMQGYAELLELRGGVATKGLYDQMINTVENRIANNWEKFNEQDKFVQELVAYRDTLDESSDEWIYVNQAIITARDGMRDLKNEMQDDEKQVEQLKEEFKDLAITIWDEVRAAYDLKDQFFTKQQDFVQSYMDRLDTLNINVPDDALREMADIQASRSQNFLKDYHQAYAELETLGQQVDETDERYIEKALEVSDLYMKYYDSETERMEYEKQILDNRFDRFSQLIDRINQSTDTLQKVSDLLGDEDVATEDGEWTAEGLTRLGVAHQQMAYSKKALEEISDEMAYYEKLLKRGQISEKEYTEKMQELTDKQWAAIDAYENQKYAIIELEEARIDMIEEGLNKEAEAYQELIDLKKEALDAERALYDFRKDVQKQTKDIAALERRIASMSGSTDASTIAEKTKLEQQLREARESLDDTYYTHGMDSMSDALDDEMEAYSKSSEDYLETLRESIKDTDLLIESTFGKVIQNSTIVLETLVAKSNEYGVILDNYLTSPWENATIDATTFRDTANAHYQEVFNTVSNSSPTMSYNLSKPYKDQTDGEGATLPQYRTAVLKTINGIIEDAKMKQEEVKSALAGGFDQAKSSVNLFKTDATSAVNAVKEAFVGKDGNGGLLASIKAIHDAITNTPNLDVGYTSPAGTTGTGDTAKTGGNYTGGGGGYSASVESLQEVLNGIFKSGLKVDGYWGTKTETALKNAQKLLKGTWKTVNTDGKYTSETRSVISNYIDSLINGIKRNGNGSSMNGQAVQQYQAYKKKLPIAFHAKGTLGIKRDEWAITDESWIGEEITLAAGKNGQLQYLKKGSAVMPADISANLVEWGKLDPKMMSIGDMSGGIQMMSNYVNKPEIKLDIENFLNVGTVSKDTLPELEKLMDKKIDTFAKQLNASIRKFK